MGWHCGLIKDCCVSRNDYLQYVRRQQPLTELERKARKSKTRANLYTQEELDLAFATAMRITTGLCVE